MALACHAGATLSRCATTVGSWSVAPCWHYLPRKSEPFIRCDTKVDWFKNPRSHRSNSNGDSDPPPFPTPWTGFSGPDVRKRPRYLSSRCVVSVEWSSPHVFTESGVKIGSFRPWQPRCSRSPRSTLGYVTRSAQSSSNSPMVSTKGIDRIMCFPTGSFFLNMSVVASLG